MRSALTALGIIIGIAAVITMVEIGRGSATAIRNTIASLGANVIQIDPSDAVKAGVSTGAGGQVTLTTADCDAIRRECSAVRWAAPSIDSKGQLLYGNRNWAPQDVRGTTPDYLQIRDWATLAEGEPFTEHDVRAGAAVCLLGQTVVRELFQGEPPLGKLIRCKNLQMKVIGVLSPKGANMLGRDQDDYVLTPWTVVKYRLSGVRAATVPNTAASYGTITTLDQTYPQQVVQLYPQQAATQAADRPQMTRFADVEDIFVSVTAPEEVAPTIRQITVLLRERHRIKEEDPDDFRIRDLTEISTTMAKTSKLMESLLLCVALISLVVGGVGIMNIMLVCVTERTREIGLRLAVGARPRDILWQFLTEAVLLCLCGGAAGIALGRLSSYLISAVLGWPTEVSVGAAVAAVLVSACVGVAFGFYPAWKASRLDPIEALRYE
jgi:ABC-type antimicrobial peptide transport system permease subunit